MKVKIGKYNTWFGPYQLADLLCFWVKKDEDGLKPGWVHDFGEWLDTGKLREKQKVGEVRPLFENESKTLLSKILSWIDSKKKRKIKVRIDSWDTWSLDSTLAYIIHPALVEYRKNISGAPFVDYEDVPEYLRLDENELKTLSPWDTDSKHFERWEWIVDEMIFAFWTKIDYSWESTLYPHENGISTEKMPDGNFKIILDNEAIDQKDKEILKEKRDAVHKRIDNGYRLFGKYYQNLWI